MSRIGKQVITIPSGVSVDLKDDVLTVRGSKGELQRTIAPEVSVAVADNTITVTSNQETKRARSQHGLSRTLISNMLTGVSEGFEKKLELHGVGYRASMSGTSLKLGVGYSHDVNFAVPEGIQVSVDSNVITVSGIDKQQVGQVAAQIREVRKPEPYKAKGIRYQDEYIVRKAGKTASA